jgi:hypothetical protein
MNVDLKIDLSQIISALILAIAAVSVARTVAPARYVPMGVAEWAGSPTGFYLDTQNGFVGIGPALSAPAK